MKRKSQKYKGTLMVPYAAGLTLLPVLTWKECVSCGKEVRYERMWHCITGPWIGGAGKQRYLCAEHADSKLEATKTIKKAVGLNRPIGPPPSITTGRLK